jgi:hypothetical protein
MAIGSVGHLKLQLLGLILSHQRTEEKRDAQGNDMATAPGRELGLVLHCRSNQYFEALTAIPVRAGAVGDFHDM